MPGNKYPVEEREGSGTNISGSWSLCLPISLFLLSRSLDNTVSFSHSNGHAL